MTDMRAAESAGAAASGRSMPRATVVALALTAVFVLSAAVVTDAPFILDELIYLMAADAFARTGGFVVGNGWDAFGSDDLRLWLLVAGPGGLVPQYPPGQAIAGWPFFALFGARGLILLNALSAGAVLLLTAALARRVSGDERVAIGAVLLLGGASFLPEYAFAIWPHALALALVTGAFLGAARALDGDPRSALWAGALAGAAVTVRADAVLVFVAIGAVAVLLARRPVAMLAAGAAGAVPFALAMAAVNRAKFGSWSPLSYGGSAEGGIDLSTHAPAIAVVVAGGTALLLARLVDWTPARRRTAALAVAVALVAAWLAVPGVAAFGTRYLRGLWQLVVDVTLVPDGRPGAAPRAEDGTRLFWGLPKKGLLQSLPWLGLLILGAAFARGAAARWAMAGLLVAAVWTLPFAPRAWHGGLGLNLRYFLPLLPLAAIGVSAVALRLWREAPVPPRVLLIAGAGGLIAALAWTVAMPSGVAGAHQILTRWAGLAVAALSAAAVLRPGLRRPALAGLAAAVGLAVAVGPLGDVRLAQAARGQVASVSQALSSVGGPVLLYGRPEIYADRVGRADAVLAVGDERSGSVDMALVRDALDAGRRVVAWGPDAAHMLRDDELVAVARWQAGGGALYEIARRP